MTGSVDTIFDANVRAVIPLVTAALVRRYGNLSDCEDAVQDALLEASVTWPRSGAPRDARAWLLTVARRRYIDAVRSDAAGGPVRSATRCSTPCGSRAATMTTRSNCSPCAAARRFSRHRASR
ncbi:sigma factor [Gryllotalpicola reticulitermitis]|uniref:Sigma factor n=1 Tax=Gryllotalpicola reticulitermitis TaxID=1184153 RepID=A0ABV8Q303_9MICO